MTTNRVVSVSWVVSVVVLSTGIDQGGKGGNKNSGDEILHAVTKVVFSSWKLKKKKKKSTKSKETSVKKERVSRCCWATILLFIGSKPGNLQLQTS